jgi:hypothetical protein
MQPGVGDALDAAPHYGIVPLSAAAPSAARAK